MFHVSARSGDCHRTEKSTLDGLRSITISNDILFWGALGWVVQVFGKIRAISCAEFQVTELSWVAEGVCRRGVL